MGKKCLVFTNHCLFLWSGFLTAFYLFSCNQISEKFICILLRFPSNNTSSLQKKNNMEEDTAKKVNEVPPASVFKKKGNFTFCFLSRI
jgi:hypothetical protein